MDGRYNTRSPAVKRLMREAQELSEPTDQYFAQPLDDNLFEWHFTIRGPADSDFQNGIYHGRIILPVDYPMKPPSIIWLTPNGRFETYKKICLSISGHHPESWQPSWSIRTALLAIIGFMPTHPGGAIGSLDYTPEERKVLAKKTKDWKCPTCGEITGILLDVNPNTQTTSDEAKELAAQINLQGEKPKCKDGECPVEQAKIAEMQSEAKESQSGAAAEPEGTQDSSDPGAVNAETNATNYTNATTAPTQTGAQAFAWPPFLAPNQQQTAIPQFPQWSPMASGFPMPPMGFPPFPYPGMPPMPPMAHMQFPYPPSHYPAFPQFPWLPQPPAPSNPVNTATPPPPSSSASISANNSANQEPNTQAETDFSSNKNTDNYTRSPMTTPIRTNTSPARTSGVSTSNAGASSSNNGPANDRDEGIKNNKGLVFKELLSKVNRVGSDIVNKEENDPQLVAQTVLSDNQEESRPEASKINFKQKLSELAKKKLKMEDASDSEVSTQKKLGRRSVSEKGDTNTEDNSDSDVPPIEADQNSAFEKGGCSSTSDLDKCKQKYSTTKGIRQRQSTTATANSTTTANVPSGLTEEGAPPVEPERAEAGTVQQRIEAISGDTGNRNRSRLAARLANNANLANRAEFDRRNRQGSYDVGFYLMVGLFATSMLILFNRLVSMEWSDSDI